MQVSETEMKAASARVAHSLMTSGLPNSNGSTKVKSEAASAKDSTASSASDSAGDITSSDFLTLLVTEMQNQDPTQPTDPNAYIQQLVGVNSLQQLISINQELGAATGATTSGAATGSISGDLSSPASLAATRNF